MANDKSFKIKNGLSATRYLGTNGTETAGTNGPYGTFSTTLYTGDSTNSRQITNGIDLANDGGMVITAPRSNGNVWSVADSERGATSWLYTNGTHAEQTGQDRYGTFNSDGYTLGSSSANSYMNFTGYTYVSWTFKQASNFFDVVTYTGNGSTQNISHNLGSVPGTIIVKKTNTTANWLVYHRSLGNDKALFLNLNSSQSTSSTYWNATTPTSSVFSVGANSNTNGNGDTFVAYLFAHDTSDSSMIKCGSYDGQATVDLGWEPHWILFKNRIATTSWRILDTTRGIPVGSGDLALTPNTTDAELSTDWVDVNSTGFEITTTNSNVAATDGSGTDGMIYIAIRAVTASQTLDLSTGHTFSITPTEATDVLFSNPPASGTATGFTVEVNNSGGYALTWPSSVKWHLNTTPTATATKEVYTFITTDGGTTYYGKKAGENLA